MMTPISHGQSVSLAWATWGLDEAEREEAALSAAALAARLSEKGDAAVAAPVTHFGPEEGQACREWLDGWPHGALLCRVKAPSWGRVMLANRRGPRPLRSSTWPWGLPDLDAS